MRIFKRAALILACSVITAGAARPSMCDEAKDAAYKTSVDAVVTANGDFAVDLYGRLAAENNGKNLFFSPYSISTALAMTAEGARGATAEQIGRVLHFPIAARRPGADAALLPWNMTTIHTGIAAINERFDQKAVSKELADEIAAKKAEIAAAARKNGDQNSHSDGTELNAAINPSPAQQLNELLAQAHPYELMTANALWCEKTSPMEPAFVQTIDKFYGPSSAFPVDFRNDLHDARRQINDWVREQTNQHIKHLIGVGQLDAKIRLVLTNSIYFRGAWAEPFQEFSTHEDDFFTGGGEKARVALMHESEMIQARYGAFSADGILFPTPEMAPVDTNKRDEKLLYPARDGFTLAEIPYKGGDLSMVVILPRDVDGLPALEKRLSNANLQAWIGKLNRRKLDVYLPRFRLDATYELALTLAAMGMVRAFNDPVNPAGGAEFDGICASQDPSVRLYLRQVIHKVYVKVNERGTEAAAETGVMFGALAADEGPVEPFTPTFRADRPFIFAIRDMKTGALLFLGRMINPKE